MQNSHGDVKYSMGNIAKNIVKTMYGAKWILEISRETLRKVYDYITRQVSNSVLQELLKHAIHDYLVRGLTSFLLDCQIKN